MTELEEGGLEDAQAQARVRAGSAGEKQISGLTCTGVHQYNHGVERKRLVLDLEEVAHSMLVAAARQQHMTIANYVRQALQLPLERQGVRTALPQVVHPGIEDSPEFYLVEQRASYQVWIPGPGSMVHQAQPTPRFLKASYASPEAVRGGQLQVAINGLRGVYPLLLLPVAHAFGPPFRAVRLFSCDARPGPAVLSNSLTYLATTSRASYSWISDLTQGKRGFFLTGLPTAADLWEVIACEPDPADRCVFVLSPVRLPHGLPSPDFARMRNPVLRAEAQQHWKNLEAAVIAHNPYGLVNAAASLAEALLREFLVAPGATGASLFVLLERLRQDLENNQGVFSWLSYHFMHAVRVMHQSTQHPGRVATTGHPIRPEFALMMTEGMIEVLTCVGMVQR